MVLSFLLQQAQTLRSNYLWTLTRRDVRVDGWPLMDSVLPTVVCVLLYWTMVVVGPRVMSTRRPLRLTYVMLVYNMFITLLNLYIFSELAGVVFGKQYNWVCQPVDYSHHPTALKELSALWLYYVSKLIEFLDTMFFILRKKHSQLTFLHVYHHSTMFVFCWIGVKWVGGGSGAIGATINSLVHVLMYSYYGLSALGPRVTPFLFWKRYLTRLQMVQFIMCFTLGVVAMRRNCPFPLWMQYTNLIYMVSFMVLFLRFYLSAYTNNKSSPSSSALTAGHNGVKNGHTNGFSTYTATANGLYHNKVL